MKINIFRFFFVLFLAGTGMFLMTIPAEASGSVGITPTSVIMTQGITQQFTVTINTDTKEIVGTDAVLQFPANAFEIVSVANGDFFTDSDFTSAIDTNNGKIEIHGFLFNDTKSGTGTLASITVRAKIGTGSGNLAFVCGTAAPTSKMLNTAGQNIIDCSLLNQSAVSFTGGTTITPSPTLTPTTTLAPTPTITQVPTATQAPAQPGYADPTCSGLTVSPNYGNQPLTATLICSGSTTNADINAAEFQFGDGRTTTVNYNAGSFGSIATTYTYTSAGSYTASCRVRDNGQRFSSTPDVCRKSLEVAGAVSPSYSETSTRLVSAATTPLPKPDAPQTAELKPYVPPVIIPTPSVSETPKSTQAVNQNTGSGSLPKTLIGIIIILASVGIGYWFIRSSRNKNPRNIMPPDEPPPVPIAQ